MIDSFLYNIQDFLYECMINFFLLESFLFSIKHEHPENILSYTNPIKDNLLTIFLVACIEDILKICLEMLSISALLLL